VLNTLPILGSETGENTSLANFGSVSLENSHHIPDDSVLQGTIEEIFLLLMFI
jgi:hypothetical protein